jgi:hypothetical protein
LSDDGERELHEDPIYKTYVQPVRVPPPRAEPAPQAPEPHSEPATTPSGEPPPQEAAREPEPDPELHEDPVYKTYVQPVRVPPQRLEPAPQAPDPPSELATTPSGEPPPQDAAREPEHDRPRPPEKPPPESLVAPAPPRRSHFKDYEFRTPEQVRRRRRIRLRIVATIAVAIVLALAYPLVNPFGSSSRSSLAPYLQRFQPIALRADQDRRSVEAAVNAVRSNPKSRKAAARRLVRANSDRQALIRQLAGLGPAPTAGRALPGRLTQLLRAQVETGRVWLRWMQHRPFVYLKNDAATRNRIQALLKSQQASKGSFTRLYAQLMRAAGLPLTKSARS